MKHPFRSETDAFRFAMVTVGAFAAIAIAKVVGGNWAALVVAALVLGAVSWWYLTASRGERPTPVAPPGRHDGAERRILVVANETVGGEELRNCIREKTEGFERSQVLVVCPALNSPLRHWASDEDPARRAAEERLKTSLARLREAGIDARGEVGDGEPLQAMEDWLRLFDADEIIISTHPEGRSHWLERGVVTAARERFTVPITHVVVDLGAGHEEVR